MKRNKRPLQPLQPGAHIYGYARDSGGQAQELSVPQQRQRVEEWAAQQQYVIVGWFTDDAKPGSSVENREGFLAMIDACCAQQHPVDAVAAWDFSRFSRDETDRAYYHALLTKQGVHFVSISQPLPEGGTAGIMREVMAYSDSEYLRTLSRNVKRGQAYVTALGRTHGAKPPPGYRRITINIGTRRNGSPRNVQRWKIDEDAAQDVREAFRMYAAGCSVHEIHDKLHLLKSYFSYSYFFTNPIFVGRLRFGDTERYDEELRIVDDATWQAVQDRKARPQPPRVASSHSLLAGLLKCGICGKSMLKQSYSRSYGVGSYHYYICAGQHSIHGSCRNRTPAEPIDRAVIDHVMNALAAPEHVATMVAEFQARATENPTRSRAQELDAQIAKAERAIDGLLDLAEAGAQSKAEIRKRLQQRETELAELRATRAELPPESALRVMDADGMRAVLERIREGLATDDVLFKRRLLTALIRRVVFTPPDDLEVVWLDTPNVYV